MPSRRMVLSCLLMSSLVGAALLMSQETPKVEKVPIKSSYAGSGAEMYKEYCAACHGSTGKGDGPAAAALKRTPSDITMIARNNNGQFPALQIRSVLEGKRTVVAHGSSDMPVWGSLFRRLGAGDQTGVAYLRISNLTKHLESLQAK